MKIILSQQEVLDIVLAAIKNKVADEFNHIALEPWRSESFCAISYIEPKFEESDK